MYPVNSKVYYCQMCKNHGIMTLRRHHVCKFKNCQCKHCLLRLERRVLLRSIRNAQENDSNNITNTNIQNNDNNTKILQASENVAAGNMESTPNGRNPKCFLCAFHLPNETAPALRGHKNICPFKDCSCFKCDIVASHRKVMSLQIRSRRAQEMELGVISGGNNNNSNNGCSKPKKPRTDQIGRDQSEGVVNVVFDHQATRNFSNNSSSSNETLQSPNFPVPNVNLNELHNLMQARMSNFLPQMPQNLLTSQAALQHQLINSVNHQNNTNIEALSYMALYYRQKFQLCQALIGDIFAQQNNFAPVSPVDHLNNQLAQIYQSSLNQILLNQATFGSSGFQQ